MQTWVDLLKNFTAKDLISENSSVISVSSEDSIIDVLKLLREKNILSAPVFDRVSKKYIGMIDVLDILTVLVYMSEFKPVLDALVRKEVDWYQYLGQEQHIFSTQTVGDLCNASERNPWCEVWYGKPITSVMDMLSKDVNLHRIPIIDDEGKVIGIVTQTDIVKFLKDKIPQQNGNRKLRDFGFVSQSEAKTCKVDDLAIDAYRKMVEERVSGLGVVGLNRKLVGVISASDIKGSLDENLFADLYLPVYNYLEKCVPNFQREESLSPITCTMDATLSDALQKLTEKRVHRLFVVNVDQQPVTEISLCDIVTMLSTT